MLIPSLSLYKNLAYCSLCIYLLLPCYGNRLGHQLTFILKGFTLHYPTTWRSQTNKANPNHEPNTVRKTRKIKIQNTDLFGKRYRADKIQPADVVGTNDRIYQPNISG